MVKLANPLQSAKAQSPIEVTLEGMVKLVNPLQSSKVRSPISVTPEGMVKLDNPLRPAKPSRLSSNTSRDGQASQATAT